jgi:uridine kinase
VPNVNQRNKAPQVIAIAGGSGSGKTWLAERLLAALGPVATGLSLDDFYRDHSHLPPGRRAGINFDHPKAIDWAAFEQVLRRFRNGRPAPIPCYDFKTHCRLQRTKTLRPKALLLVEGLWLLRRRQTRSLFGLTIFLDCPTRVRLSRRLARDMAARGRSRRSVVEQFWRTVEPMHAKYVAPQARLADLVLRGNCCPGQIVQLAARARALLREV